MFRPIWIKNIKILLFISLFWIEPSRAENQCLNLFFNNLNISSDSSIEHDELSFNEKMKLFLIYKPLKDSWLDKDKRFFTFFESPLRGLADGIPGIILARWISGLDVFDSSILMNYKDTYLSYQTTNLFRNGINLNKKISDRLALLLSWYYSAISYSIITAGPTFLLATTSLEYTHAWSLVTYSVLWPLFSQSASRKFFVPFLFSRYPRSSELKEIGDRSVKTKTLLSNIDKEILNFELELKKEKLKKIKISYLKSELFHLNHVKKWIIFFRKDLADGAGIPKKRFAKMAAQKQRDSLVITTFMVATYLVLRNYLIGDALVVEGPFIKDSVSYVYSLLSEGAYLSEEKLRLAMEIIKKSLKYD